jgi:hypothetical protein
MKDDRTVGIVLQNVPFDPVHVGLELISCVIDLHRHAREAQIPLVVFFGVGEVIGSHFIDIEAIHDKEQT